MEAATVQSMNSTAADALSDGELVRFRGMVQDMHDPEFYFDTFEIVDRNTKLTRLSSGKYRDTSDVGESEYIDYNSPNLKSAERHTITLISFPGLNEWVREFDHAHPRHADGVVDGAPPSLKRSLDERDAETSAESGTKRIENKSHATPSATDTRRISRERILNFPLPNENGKQCMVKVYENFETIKLNDTVEVTGYLSVNPALSDVWNNSNDRDVDLETLAHNPPPSLVPRIHATRIEKLQHCNPLLEFALDKEIISKDAEARECLHKIVTQILFGDSLAADYFICSLISQIYSRQDLLTLGKFCLNLWKIPNGNTAYTSQLYDVITKLVTKSHYLPLTIENLNNLSFIPRKDYESNRLISAILQLSKNTHLILDETKMQPGQLNNTGVINVQSLKNVIENQKVKYDFKYYEMEYDCDIPILILSEGKSLLPSDFSLPIIVDEAALEIINATFEAVNFYLNETILNKIRAYLTTVRLTEFKILEQTQFIEDDFISMRSENDPKDFNEDDMHRLLVLARLICLSRGYNTLNEECWNVAKEMEKERKIRVKTHS